MTQSQAITVNFTKNKDIAKVLPCGPLVTSQRSGWKHIGLQKYGASPAWETPTHTSVHHLIAIALETGPMVERRIGDTRKTERVRAGHCMLVPESAEHWCAWSTPGVDFIVIELEHNFLSQIAYEYMDPDRTELVPTFLQPDPFIYGVGVALNDTLVKGRAGDFLYVETLTKTLAMHLLRYYATHSPDTREDEKDGLSRQQLKRALDCLNSGFNQPITLARIPILLGMSQYRFSRLFQQSTGVSPYQYVVQKRVERARQLLSKSPELPLNELAKQSGFVDRDHLTRHFSRLTGKA